MNKKIINDVLQSINGGTTIQKLLSDFKKKKGKYQKIETFQTVSIGISVFLDNTLIRCHYFGKSGTSVSTSTNPVIRSIKKGEELINSSENIYRSVFVKSTEEENFGGALRSNGITISCSGFKNNMKNEHLSWLIMFAIERRVNELGFKFNDTRYHDIDNNPYVVAEKIRMTNEFNNFKKE